MILCTDAFVGGLGEVLRKPKGIRSRAIRLVMLQPLPALCHSRNVARRNPPQTVMRLVHLFKQLCTITQDLSITGLGSVMAQRLDGVPNGQTHDNKRFTGLG